MCRLIAPLARWQRVICMADGVTLIKLGFWSDLIGVGLMDCASIPQLIGHFTSKREPTKEET